MYISARTLFSYCLVGALGAATLGCASFKATDKILFDPKGRAGNVQQLPAEHIGDLPPTVVQGQVVHITPVDTTPTSSTQPFDVTAQASSDGPLRVVDPYSLSSNQVRQLQQGLIDQGFNPDALSGVFGRQTEDALGAFMVYNYPSLPLQRRVLEVLGVTF